jgi:purine-binding chemotaxis protein CheW
MNGKGEKKMMVQEQQTALVSYLEDLLKEVPEYTDTESEAVVPTDPTRAGNVIEVFPGSMHQDPTPGDPLSGQPAAEPEPEDPSASSANAETQTAYQPDWAAHEFQCLLFHVSGITLAVPLVKLNGVIPWSDNITPMPGHSAAFMGLLRHLDQNVRIMDTAEVILPQDQRGKNLIKASERVQKILLMDEGRWGLACDDIGEVVTLHSRDVRWRTAQGKRPWLAGTISARLCALLDTDALAQILEAGMPASG